MAFGSFFVWLFNILLVATQNYIFLDLGCVPSIGTNPTTTALTEQLPLAFEHFYVYLTRVYIYRCDWIVRI